MRIGWNERTVGLCTHANDEVAVDVFRRRVMSGTDIHRPGSVLRQTCLSHVRWSLQRAAAVQQSSTARLHSSQAQTGSAGHYVRLQELFPGVSSELDDDRRSRRHQQH